MAQGRSSRRAGDDRIDTGDKAEIANDTAERSSALSAWSAESAETAVREGRSGDSGSGTANVFRTAGHALLHWLWATVIDAVLVGILWFIGLMLLHVPFAPLWAGVGALCQFVPVIGSMLALIGPALTLAFSGGHWEQFGLLLGLYAVIVVIDQLLILPLLLHRMNRIPIWAAIFGPIILGLIIPFWGVILAPPLMAVIFALLKLNDRKRTVP